VCALPVVVGVLPVRPVVEVSGRPSAMFAEAVLQADEASVLKYSSSGGAIKVQLLSPRSNITCGLKCTFISHEFTAIQYCFVPQGNQATGAYSPP
jgi:hypothetical protein